MNNYMKNNNIVTEKHLYLLIVKLIWSTNVHLIFSPLQSNTFEKYEKYARYKTSGDVSPSVGSIKDYCSLTVGCQH